MNLLQIKSLRILQIQGAKEKNYGMMSLKRMKNQENIKKNQLENLEIKKERNSHWIKKKISIGMMNSRLNRVEKRIHKLEDSTEELIQNIGQTNR